jgi:hypothetical protein
MVKVTGKRESEQGMETRLRRYFTLALVVFVIVNILALVLVLNAYLKNTGDVTKFATANGATSSSITGSNTATVLPRAVSVQPLSAGESVFIHLKPGNPSCTTKVVGILEDNGLVVDTELTDPLDLDDQELGLIAIRKNVSSTTQLNKGLTAVKRNAFSCLDTQFTLSGTTTQASDKPVVKSAPSASKTIYLDDDEDEDEDDWIEYDAEGGPQLAQSVPFIGADLVNKPISQGGKGIDGAGVDVCIIDTGIEEGYMQSSTFVNIPNTALPPVLNGFNPKPGSGLKTEYNATDSEPKFKKIQIIDDEDIILGHGTVMAGVIASISPVSGSGISTKSPGVAPKINLMVAKLPNTLAAGTSYKSNKTNFLKALKFCLGKNRSDRKAEVVFSGFSFNDVIDKTGEPFDLFTEKWQVMGEKNPADKKQKGDSTNNIKSVKKIWDKYGKAHKKPKSSDPYTVPLIVPVGNNANGPSKNGVPNSLALLDFSVGVGSVFDDAGLPPYGGGDSLPSAGSHTCDNTTTSPGNVLCDTSCHVNAAGSSVVTVVAPGYHIFAPSVGDGTTGPHTGLVSGTSVAAAHVAGVMALMKQAGPSTTVAQLKSTLQSTATKANSVGTPLWTVNGVPQSCYGGGIVNALEAIDSMV